MVERPSSGSGALPLVILLLLAAVGTLVLNQPEPVPLPSAQVPMLADPEADSYEWDSEVWAFDATEAAQKCRRDARGQTLTEFLRVEQTSKRPSRYGQFRFKCWFQSEDLGEPYYVPSDRNP